MAPRNEFPVDARRTKPDLSAYFLAAGAFLSCFGFMLFLSFFCELLPLPMLTLLRVFA